MVKIVDMTSALQQVREKAPDTADAMKRFKSGNAGFTDKAHLKAKGMIPRSDGTKKVSDKYKEDLDKKDVATIKPIIKQLQKSVKSHDKQAKQLTKDISDEKDLEEAFTKADFKDNERDNEHGLNAKKVVDMFGTGAEKMKIDAINARHNMRGSISREDQRTRDDIVNKYYSRLK